MSSFFSLGGSKDQQDQDQHQQQHTDTNSSLFLFKNEEIYNKGFELWQQYYQLHQQRAHHQSHHQSSIQDVDFSVGPSRRNNETNSSNLIINPSSSGHNIGDDSLNYNSYRLSSSSSGFGMMTRQGRSIGSEGINCQDCGNQAKKDCMHMRCRTCCKSRGFECQTHVKSTWVPAAKRRERQQQVSALSQQQQQVNVRGESSGKRLSDDSSGVGGGGNSTSMVACTTANSSRLAANSSGFELGHFPAEVNSPAVFRCVRVRAVDDPEEHLAYQTAVNIAGHVFKGVLYDQGPENRYSTSMTIGGGGGSSRQRPLNLIAGAAATTAATTTSAAITGSSNMNITSLVSDPSSMNYPTPLSSFMAGTQFFPPPRP